jgi:diguanylate cyclase
MIDLKSLREFCKQLTVLYVEDEETLRGVVKAYFDNFFKHVEIGVDGLDGLEKYKKCRYDIVITDIKMPKLDGLEMSKAIKQINSEQSIVIVSAYSHVENFIDAIKTGIDGYIIKPVDFDQINDILFKIASQIKNRKENEHYKSNLEKIIIQKTNELKKQYILDKLTNLYNKSYLDELLEMQCQRTLLLLNVDNFGMFNDNYGFDVGDAILVEISKKLSSLEIKEKSFLFRLSGDEFVFLFEDLSSEKALAIAHRIKDHFIENLIVIDELKLNVSFTMAIDNGYGKEILRNASLSIHEIREVGKNHIKVFEHNTKYSQIQKDNIFWINELQNTLNSNTIRPYFQPILNIKTNQTKKYESLVRIVKNDQVIPPFQFLGPAKLAGIMSEITKKMIEESFKMIQGTDTMISINVVEQDFKENYLVDFLESKSKQFKLKPSQIVLEILESISVNEKLNELIITQLETLKKLGYKLSIDDFGTENSNFSRLLYLQVDYIKIDGSFIKNLDTDERSQKIVKAIVNFAHSINAEVIAEFVHSETIYNLLVEFDIDYAQGYYVGKPQGNLVGC